MLLLIIVNKLNLNQLKARIKMTKSNTATNALKQARNIVQVSMAACDSSTQDYDLSEMKALVQEVWGNLQLNENDFFLEDIEGGEVRVIHSSIIDQLWTDGLLEIIKEGFGFHDTPDYVEIDWYATVENCKIDGIGSHFASYDGNEHQSGDYYIFRVN
jgi:hypothetical protein